jgi:hypothetical protein
MTLEYHKEMTRAECKQATEMGKYAIERGRGKHIIEDLKLGDSLLIGRMYAIKAAAAEQQAKDNMAVVIEVANGRMYANHFTKWKAEFGFPTTKEYSRLYDACIYCAQHRDESRSIMESWSDAERAKYGIFKLENLTHEIVREQEGEPRKKKKSPEDTPRAQIKDLEQQIEVLGERLSDELSGLLDQDVDEVANTISRHYDIHRLRDLIRALQKIVDRMAAAMAKPAKIPRKSKSTTAQATKE